MRSAKFFISALTAALASFSTFLGHGAITSAQWMSILIAAAGAVGVYYIPNKADEPTGSFTVGPGTTTPGPTGS